MAAAMAAVETAAAARVVAMAAVAAEAAAREVETEAEATAAVVGPAGYLRSWPESNASPENQKRNFLFPRNSIRRLQRRRRAIVEKR